MARVFYGGIVTDMIGSVGGLTFQHNRAGKIVRVKPLQKKLITFKQSARVMAFQKAMNFWNIIEQGSKEEWAAWADTYTYYDNWGVVKSLNGYNWFLSINSYRELCGEPMLEQIGDYATPLAVPGYWVVFSPTEVSVEWGQLFVHPDHYLLVYTTRPLRNNSPQNRSALRLTKIIARGTSGLVNITSDWETTHNITLPVAGGTNALSCIFAVQSVHYLNGIASVFLSYFSMYEP